VRAAINVQRLAGHEDGRRQVQHRLDHLRTSPIRPNGCIPARNEYVSGVCIGVLKTPGATALTRMPLSAYSIASDLVTASRPPLVSDASADGTPLTGWFTSVVVRLTTCSAALSEHLPYSPLRDVEEPGQVTASTCSKSAAVYSVNGQARNTSALLNSVSTRSNRLNAATAVAGDDADGCALHNSCECL
jgi:hypothetical protein